MQNTSLWKQRKFFKTEWNGLQKDIDLIENSWSILDAEIPLEKRTIKQIFLKELKIQIDKNYFYWETNFVHIQLYTILYKWYKL